MCGLMKVDVDYLGAVLAVDREWEEIRPSLQFLNPEVLGVVKKEYAVTDLCWTRQELQEEDGKFQLDDDSLHSPGKQTVLDILWIVGKRAHTDPRDIIFSMATFWREDTPRIIPDYSLSVDETFSKSNHDCIRHSRLQVLCFAGIGYQKTYTSNLPSWFPDWSHNNSNDADPSSFMFEYAFSYSSYCSGLIGSHIGPSPTFSTDQRSITVQGILCDFVEDMYPLESGQVQPWWEPNGDVCKGLIQSLLKRANDSTPVNGMPPLQAFFRTLLDDMNYYGRRLGLMHAAQVEVADERALSIGGFIVNFLKQFCNSSKPSFRANEGPVLSEMKEESDLYELAIDNFFGEGEKTIRERWQQWNQVAQKYVTLFQKYAWEDCDSRSFFITSKGYMGKSAPFARKGDILCIFQDCKVPCLVRKDGAGFCLVGEALAIGLMDGEDVANQGYADKFESIVLH